MYPGRPVRYDISSIIIVELEEPQTRIGGDLVSVEAAQAVDRDGLRVVLAQEVAHRQVHARALEDFVFRRLDDAIGVLEPFVGPLLGDGGVGLVELFVERGVFQRDDLGAEDGGDGLGGGSEAGPDAEDGRLLEFLHRGKAIGRGADIADIRRGHGRHLPGLGLVGVLVHAFGLGRGDQKPPAAAVEVIDIDRRPAGRGDRLADFRPAQAEHIDNISINLGIFFQDLFGILDAHRIDGEKFDVWAPFFQSRENFAFAFLEVVADVRPDRAIRRGVREHKPDLGFVFGHGQILGHTGREDGTGPTPAAQGRRAGRTAAEETSPRKPWVNGGG
jgi:hypothetical protein